MKAALFRDRIAFSLKMDAICGIAIWSVAIVLLLMVTGK